MATNLKNVDQPKGSGGKYVKAAPSTANGLRRSFLDLFDEDFVKTYARTLQEVSTNSKHRDYFKCAKLVADLVLDGSVITEDKRPFVRLDEAAA